MTTPAGVPNLPKGALTLDNLASATQDMSGSAMHSRAAERMPGIFESSTGGNILFELSPFGILTRIWAEITSLIANADPADIQGPEDLPALFIEFIEGLPVIGQFIDVLDAILGTYEGEDATLLAIQEFFAPVRALLANVVALFTEITSEAFDIVAALGDFVGLLATHAVSIPQTVITGLVAGLAALLPWDIFGIKNKQGVNLCADGDFEKASFWQYETTSGGSGISTEQAYTGTQSFKIVGISRRVWVSADGTPGQALTAHRWKIRRGGTVSVTARVRRHASNSGTGTFQTMVAAFPGTGSIIPGNGGSTVTGDITAYNTAQSGISTTQFDEITATHTFPISGGAGDYVEFTVGFGSGPTVGASDAFYVDRVEVRDIAEHQSLMDTLTGIAGSTLSTVTSWVNSIAVAIDDVFDTLFDLLWDLAGGFVSVLLGIPIIGELIGTVIGWAIDGIQDLFDNAEETYDSLPMSGTYATITATSPPAGTQATPSDVDATMEFNGSSWDVIAAGTDGRNLVIEDPEFGTEVTLGPPAFSGGTTITLNAGSSIAQDYDGVLVTAWSNSPTPSDRIQARRFTPTYSSLGGVIALVEYGCLPASQSSGGLLVRDSDGKYITFGLGYISGTMNLHVHRWNNNISFNSIVSSQAVNLFTNGGPRLLGIFWDGTHIFFWASYNGREWQRVYFENDSAFFNGSVSHWGYYGYCTIESFTTRLRVRKTVEVDGS